MKTKKIFASMIAVAGLFTCMAASTASAWDLHNCGSIRYTESKSFVDSSTWLGDRNANVNSCSYSYSSGKATVSISSIEHKYTNPSIYISGEGNNGGWTYFIDNKRGAASKKISVKNAWGKLYKNIDFETQSLCSRLGTTY